LPSTGVGANLGGTWNIDSAPYMREILRATTTPGVREFWVQKSSQVGLTELLFNIALYFVAVLGRSLLIVYPTKAKGVKVNERRLVPAIWGCAATARLLWMGRRKAATIIEWCHMGCGSR
jgi:phage terminase large subunit GpA-like protein